jgi:hypothetical protein
LSCAGLGIRPSDFLIDHAVANCGKSRKESRLSKGNCMFYSKYKNRSTNSSKKGVDMAL